MSTYILWDIDGTLIYNTPTAGGLYLDAIEHVTGVRPTVPVEEPHGMTEGQLLAAILEVNGQDVSRVGEVLYDLDVLSREQHERGHVRDACVGVDAALEAVSARGWTNALLTGNGPNRARYKLLAAGIDPALFDWEHSYFGHESPTRHHLTAGARSALGPDDAFIIGDTPNDGLAADSAGIPFVAVATGVYSADELRSTSAIVVTDNLADGLDDVLEAIGAVVGSSASTPENASAPENIADGSLEDFGENPDVEVSDSDEAPLGGNRGEESTDDRSADDRSADDARGDEASHEAVTTPVEADAATTGEHEQR